MAKTATKRKKPKAPEVIPVVPSYCFDWMGGSEPYLNIGGESGFEAVFTGPIRNFDGTPQTPEQSAREMRKTFFDLIGVMKQPMLELPTTLGEFTQFDLRHTFFLAECVRVRSGCTPEDAWGAVSDIIPEISSDYWYEKSKEADYATI